VPLLALWGALAALSGCTGSGEEAVAASGALEGSWVSVLVQSPEQFTARLEPNREGWIALHRNDWRAAVAGGGDPEARAHEELARFYRVLAGLETEAWARTGATWRRRGDLPEGSMLPWLVGAALTDAGRDEEATVWPAGEAPSELLAARKRLHDAVRAGSEPDTSVRAEGRLLASEQANGGVREFSDPWLLRTLSQTEGRAADAVAPLDRDLFSSHLATDVDLPAREANPAADADACRERVRALDGDLDGWRSASGAAASQEGRQLLSELRLVEGARARALTDLAVSALLAQRSACALAFGQMALDYEAPRAIGVVNSPTLFAVVASAQLHAGRTREALDAIEVLRPVWPEVAGLDETLSTLVVLEGMDRSGDSRE
jgi:hypothetical protein